MSEANSKPAPAAKAAAAKAGGPSVIRRVEGAAETAHERLTKKLLPAWVISGALNIAFLAIAYVVSVVFAAADPKPNDKIVATTVEKETPEEEKPPLTEEDVGLDSSIPPAVESDRLAEQNVEAKTTEDTVGTPDPKNDPSAFAPPGAMSENATGGAPGDAGNVMAGLGGAPGLQVGGGNAYGRSGGTKNMLLDRGGGNKESEAAVARGLAWLARQQKPDGSWVYDGSEKGETVAATGMALLPFLAAGETHKSGKKYQKNVSNGIKFLLTKQRSDGGFNSAKTMYAQAIGALAMIECYGMTKDAAFLKTPTQKVVNFIQEAQGPDGSWGYQPKTAGDTSIVGWQIQALHSAKLSKDLVVNDKILDRAKSFLDKVSGGSLKATYGYRDGPGGPGTSLTAVGLLCRYYESGWGPNNPGMAEGVKGLMTKPPRKAFFDMYYYYYATQVVHFYETDFWHKQWNPTMRDMLIELQAKKEGPAYGSWDADSAKIGQDCGRLGTTCMCLLTLEVYYRHLPLYKRAGGDGLKEVDRVN